jgi:hypothetical protein
MDRDNYPGILVLPELDITGYCELLLLRIC